MDVESSATYVERAVQTEPPRHFSRSDDSKALNMHDPLPLNDCAYTQISSISIPKREHKLSQLAYQKPSELNTSNKRIVSLPETSPPSRINPDNLRDRVVSMSDSQVKISAMTLTSSVENSLSSDCFESSIDTSQSQISSDQGNMRLSRASRRSLVFPQTPSPPSSPESVMIIGNNVQVPSSFLRQKAVEELDDDGWTSWASSPPRPIPALHGPLSLPYARCPSGAEGTIIEGEDATRTIWGLGNDPNRDHKIDIQLDQVFKPNIPRTELPSRFRTLSNTPSDFAKQQNIAGKPVLDDTFYISPNLPDIDDQHHIQHLSDRSKQSFKGRVPVKGLGLVWDESHSSTLHAQARGHNDRPHLKASAPEFVPSGRLSQQSQPRISVGSPVARSHYIVPKPQMPAIDLAFEYRAQQEGRTPLLASPRSASTTWSPQLPTPLPLHADRFADVWSSEDAADELRRFIYERIGQQNLSPSDLKQISELARSMNLDRGHVYPTYDFPVTKISPASPSFDIDIDFHHPGPAPSQPLPPLLSHRSEAVASSPSMSLPRAGGRFNIQPRSVPFARLLQRRLSVVPEEPSPTSELPPASPRITRERPTFGASADAQHFKPYFARSSSGPKTSRLPDISNHANEHERARLPISTSEPFASSNLVQEVEDYIQLGPPSHSRAPQAFQGGGGGSERESYPERQSRKPRSSASSSAGMNIGREVDKENGRTHGKSASVDSTKNGVKTFAAVVGKETGRRKKSLKTKPKKQEHNASSSPSIVEPPTGDPWLSGPALEAWLA